MKPGIDGKPFFIILDKKWGDFPPIIPYNEFNNLETMKQKFDDAGTVLDEALEKIKAEVAPKAKMRKVEGASPDALIETPGDAITATEAALVDLKEILNYFRENFLDDKGNLIKIGFWKWLFVKKYRMKVGNGIEYLVGKIKTIAGRFR